MSIRIIVTCAALASSSVALAQTPPGRFGQSSAVAPENLVSAQIGRCVVGHDHRDASTYVTVHSGSAEFKAVVAALMPAMKKCLAGARSATIDPAYLRGGIAEELLLEKDATLLDRASSQPAIAPVRLTSVEADEPVVAVMACATMADPASAVTMLRNTAQSPGEAAAFRTLAPAIQACVPASGEFRLKPARIRPAVAISLYRRVIGQ